MIKRTKWDNMAYAEFNRTKGLSAFNFRVDKKTRGVNQYVREHVFSDGSRLQVSDCKQKVNLNFMRCYNTAGEAQAIRVLFK